VNAPGRDQPALGRTADGTVVFCRPGDPDVDLITALRETLDRVDPVSAHVAADAYLLGDLRGQARIPQYGAFVRELLRDEAPAHDTAKGDRA
jgi:hypothetical protein